MTPSEKAQAEILIELALREDLGGEINLENDLSSSFFIPRGISSRAQIVARENAVVCGGEIAALLWRKLDKNLQIEIFHRDGAAVTAGAIIAEISGASHAILTGERSALNFLQYLSGIATTTAEFVQIAHAHNPACQICDTRKTLPAYRLLAKYAVRCGGGTNHRIGLFDAAMLKDNHLFALAENADFAQRLKFFREKNPHAQVFCEADTLAQVERFCEFATIDIILLDNMPPAQIKTALAINRERKILEASGGISRQNLATYAATGVPRISLGALTHSARNIDLGLDFVG